MGLVENLTREEAGGTSGAAGGAPRWGWGCSSISQGAGAGGAAGFYLRDRVLSTSFHLFPKKKGSRASLLLACASGPSAWGAQSSSGGGARAGAGVG